MDQKKIDTWESRVMSPEQALAGIEPGMRVFIGTGCAEPRALVRQIMSSSQGNLQDLELVQIISLGDAISLKTLHFQKFRLKTFFAGWLAGDAIASGQVDLIPCRFSRIPRLFESGAIPIDAAFVQITPPDEAGDSSLGIAVDLAQQAIAKAAYVVGEINENIPRTQGDTFVHISQFHALVKSDEPPIHFPRWQVDETFDKVAANVAAIIDDGACVSFSLGPLFEALSPHLARRKGLGVHTHLFTDPLMDLVKSGAVDNRRKGVFRGKCLASYAIGTPELLKWLNSNPLVEFQGIDVVGDPSVIGRNERFMAIIPARKVDITGSSAFHFGKSVLHAGLGLGEMHDLFAGATLSAGGKTILGLPSRNLAGEPNILPSVEGLPLVFSNRESVDLVATEYGVAHLKGRTQRQRAAELISIAHPDFRDELTEAACKINFITKGTVDTRVI